MDTKGLDYDSIICSIRSRLTGDWEHDREFLLAQMELYKDHPTGKEIIRECGRLLYEATPEDLRRQVDQAILEHNDETEDTLMEVGRLMSAGNPARALEVIEPLAQKMDSLIETGWNADDTESRYFNFRNDKDEYVWRAHNKDEHRTIRQTTENFALVYTIHASCLFEAGRTEEAIQACKKAIRWNPTDVKARFELGESYKRLGNMDRYEQVLRDLFPYVATADDLAHYHRGLGYLRMEQERYRSATAHLLVSLYFEKSPLALNELMYMKMKLGQDHIQMGPSGAVEVLRSEGEAIYIDEDTRLALEKLLKVSRWNNDDRLALELAADLFNTTKEERYRLIAHQLMDKLGIHED